MFGIFKSASQKQSERDYEDFLDALSKSLAAAEREIRTLESEIEPRLRRQAAVVLVNAVIYSDRTVASVQALQRRVEKQEADNRLQAAIGTSLASRLILCGVLLLHLKGEAWLKGSLAFAHIEGILKGFVEHYGVPSWPVAYVQDIDFERFRQDRFAQDAREKSELNGDTAQ